MTTLPLPDPHNTTGRTREALELAARRGGLPLQNVSAIHRAMSHWPEWLEANLAQTAATFKGQGQLSALTRECLHIAISASNNCRF
ncbi:MAG: hypothetical protein AB7K36_24565 [Chloroflexota bacterium]